jgi:hypothetical protein
MAEKRRRERDATWRALVLGCVVLVGVFVWLQSIGTRPQDDDSVEAARLREEQQRRDATDESRMDSDVSVDRETAEASADQSAHDAQESASGDVAKAADEAAFFDAQPVLVLTGPRAYSDDAIKRDQLLLRRAVERGGWDAYRQLLRRSVLAVMDNLRIDDDRNDCFDSVWKEAALVRALLRWHTLGVFPESVVSDQITDLYTGEIFLWLLDRSAAMEELLLTVKPQDDPDFVLKFLRDVRSADMERYATYFPLALACAVVFDQPVRIEHPLGSSATHVDPIARYNWFLDQDMADRLEAPVSRSDARDLVWVVCAPVATSELEWSLDHMHLRRKRWGNAYTDVEYLMERAVSGENPYETYTFAEILKKGGICGDQSYLCVNTARAQGIPAMILTGQTNEGPHAWAGIKIDDSEWSTAAGRVDGSTKGATRDPQTGLEISEQEILHWNERDLNSRKKTLEVSRHLWLARLLRDAGSEATAATAVTISNRIGGVFLETWRELFGLLERGMQLTGDPPVPSNLKEWKEFVSRMRRQFRENPRMAALAGEAEFRYILPYEKDSKVRGAMLRERRRISRESGEQADLIAESLRKEAELLLQRGGNDAKDQVASLYDRALRQYGANIAGFEMMADDYFSWFRDDPERAGQAVRDIERAFDREIETGNKDWFRANVESGIYTQIADYYRSVGEEDRASRLEKRRDTLMRRAERAAE